MCGKCKGGVVTSSEDNLVGFPDRYLSDPKKFLLQPESVLGGSRCCKRGRSFFSQGYLPGQRGEQTGLARMIKSLGGCAK